MESFLDGNVNINNNDEYWKAALTMTIENSCKRFGPVAFTVSEVCTIMLMMITGIETTMDVLMVVVMASFYVCSLLLPQ